MRLNVATWSNYILADDGACLFTYSGDIITAAFTDAELDGSTTSDWDLTRGAANVGTTSSDIAAATSLTSLEWKAGLAMAAFDQATYLASATSDLSGSDNTFAERVAEYGTAAGDSTEIIIGSDYRATWVVLQMLIDDLDNTDASRTALLSSTIAQIGLSSTANDFWTTVYVAALDSTFTESDSFECPATTTVTDVVVVVDAAARLAAAATTLIAATLLM
jgi:hypothetical protein